ncbi:MAG: oxidoreductase [Desulfobulbaceae bacterium]|nr:oxidoreductase [Desulfobulbaceae bacterium]
MYKSHNPFRPIRTEVLDVIGETPTIKTLRLRPEESLTFDTGQFIELTVPGVGEAPFTPSSDPTVKDVIEISVMKVGKVTGEIHDLKKGAIVGLRGPFGTKYPLDVFKGKELLIVGGGCGLAPIRSLVYECFNRIGEFKSVFFRGGCRAPQEFLYFQEIQEWIQRGDIDITLTVDEGNGDWKGPVGVVTNILDNIDMDYTSGVAVVCGPPVMMKFTVLKLFKLGFLDTNVYVSMEKNMSCGLGKCGHCRIGTYYACKDGPVFRYDLIKNFPNIWR